jgi:hypothetical protein
MDNELDPLEAELRRLRPIAPSRDLERALGAELSAGPRRSAKPLAWLALPIGAAIAGLVAWWPERIDKERTASDGAVFKPVAAQNVLLASTEQGGVTLADGTPARRVRRAYLDTITWENPRTHASLIWTVPREEVRVTPIDFQ